MKRKIWTLSESVLFLLLTGVVTSEPVANSAEIDLLILAGQSNMVGQANITATIPGMNSSDHRIEYYFDVTNTSGSFADDSDQTFGPLRPWRFDSNTSRMGPEMALGRNLASQFGFDLALIKLAVGGSDIARWQPSAGVDYLALVEAVSDGVLELLARGDTVNLLGMVWLQGESDALSTSRADAYSARLDAFINGFRTQMESTHQGLGFADLKLFLVEPANWKNGSNPSIASAANIAKVNQALLDFADSNTNAWHIPTDDFVTYDDGLIHFSAADQVSLGARIADSIHSSQVPEPSVRILVGLAVLAFLLIHSGYRRANASSPW